MTPSDRTVLSDLLARLEGATGPDRTLDSQVWCAAHGYEWRQDRAVSDPAVTASLDQALALVEAVLPGEFIELSGPRKYLNIPAPVPNHWCASVGLTGSAHGWGAAPALALLAAMLRALIAQESVGVNSERRDAR